MPCLGVNRLVDSISQMLVVPPDICDSMAEEIQHANISYKALYKDFHSGGWYTATLYAPGESSGDDKGVVCDGIPEPTMLARRLPTTQRFLEGLALDFFMVRIARMEAASCLWEHRDYVELNGDRERLRLHVPIITNPAAAIHFSGWEVHMARGWLWKLDPTISHAASNSGSDARTHLILDCYVNKTLKNMLAHQTLDQQHLLQQPKLEAEKRHELLQQAQELFRLEGREKAEQHLLKTFHCYDLEEETSYDILAGFYAQMDFRGRENYWIQEQITRIYTRVNMEHNAMATDVGSMKFARPHTAPRDLPQLRMLEQILESLQQFPGLEKAYVRGSLARGNADLHSDIDLLCEVLPQHFASFLAQADTSIKRDHNSVAEGLVDTIVKDFGGIGYIYLLEAEGRLYQLDFYVTCQGRPWGSETYRREILCRNAQDDTGAKYQSLLYRLHSETVDQQIHRLQNIESSVGQTLSELSVLGVMLKKCLERGDGFVASNEYLLWKNCFVKLIRHKFDTQYCEYGFYHLKRLAVEVGDGGRLFDDLRAIFTSPMTSSNFEQVHRYAMDFAEKHFAEDCARQRRLIDAVSRHIGSSDPEAPSMKLAPWPQVQDTLDLLYSA